MELINPPGNIDKLLEEIDSLTETIRSEFKDYTVSFSGLPDQNSNLSLDNKNSARNDQSRTLDLSIEGPTSIIPQQATRRRRG